ncbi:GntR family transcriptional regulator [Microbacterium elymi]|uniref:GntR family transcriptional regulator n=1 Tax=Microbacterium elymi TaxID=2909587 RepID=A0ABY5NHR7_9MICO|nr:GntR family transcriptional regulator [Microbacterium elymi]UUT34674.1 GntR family transcriptional regulator [Microbacterium elymi]
MGDLLAPYRPEVSSRGGAAGDAARTLREAILDGVLAPDVWLREVAVSEALGVSRTPIREAFNRLEEEGLVARTPGVGAQVTRLSFEDMSAVYQVRGSLESLAADYATRQGHPEHLAQFDRLHARMTAAAAAFDLSEFSRANVEFHHLLSVAADNAYLSRLLSTVEVAIRRFGTRSLSQERMDAVLGEHGAIIEAMHAGDAERAGEAAAAHAARARISTLTRLLGHPV